MKACTIRLDPASLLSILGIPAGAVVTGVRTGNELGTVELCVIGHGPEVKPGDKLQEHIVVLQCKHDADGLWTRHGVVPAG